MSDTDTQAEAMPPKGMTPSRDDFASLLAESGLGGDTLEGTVVRGRVTAIENDMVMIDVGLKAEGRVPLREFGNAGQTPEIAVGDDIDVFLDRIENAMGEAVLSRDKARREESWTRLEKSFEAKERIEGVIFGRVKGGFTVDLGGATAFLPGSLVDVRPVRDITLMMQTAQPFQILKMDRRRGNIVVSRRAVVEESRAEARDEALQTLSEGQIVDGIVRVITEYGAFVEVADGIDGLLHVTDMAWRRVGAPAEIVETGQEVKVKIIKINRETGRLSLGMKQLDSNPWENAEAQFPVGTRVKGRVTNIATYGAFVELEGGIEGLVHVTQMSWVKKNTPPEKLVSTSQEVEVEVLEVDIEKQRISLGMKQCTDNPWETFAAKYPPGTHVKGPVKNITEFGLFVGLDYDIDGMVYMSDLDWDKPGTEALGEYERGDEVEAVVLDVKLDKEQVTLGIKQLSGDPFASLADMKRGDTVTCEVTAVTDGGLEVTCGQSDISAFIRRSDLSRDREGQRPERFNRGDKLDAMITNLDPKTRRINLSIKALEIAEEKEAVEQYGSSDSGASLGDILAPALKSTDETDESEASDDEKKADATAENEATDASAKDEAAATDEGEAESDTAPDEAAATGDADGMESAAESGAQETASDEADEEARAAKSSPSANKESEAEEDSAPDADAATSDNASEAESAAESGAPETASDEDDEEANAEETAEAGDKKS